MYGTLTQQRHAFKPKLIALSVAACFGLSTQAHANPTGGTVAAGSASFAVSGNTLTITNSAGAIINWASFSIGVNEITQFLQSSGASAVLNRVVGLNGVIPQSVIDGILSSNGRVFLLNQSGIVIGSTARIDVAGFVASSLNLSDQDFLNGRMRFTETPGAGGVSNAGVINTSSGGSVFLVAPDVQNSGIIRSPQGQIVLAAGRSVELASEGSPFVTVNITADSEQALNVGQLISDSGRIGMFGALVRQGGVIEANSAIAGANGEIRLVATQNLVLEAGSRTTANGVDGGNVILQAQGGTNAIYGTVEATGSSGHGGTVQALGVRVGVLGHGVIDASGDTGGGTVLVGGDRHGDNPNVQNAEQVLIGPDGVIRADARTTGDGGRVIVWSDNDTRVYGTISAQGGSQSGNGGFVETSSGGGMDLTGIRVDTRAAYGLWGTWLLDPDNVIFEPNGYGAGDPLVYGNLLFSDNPGTTAHITAGTIETAFATNGTVQVQATNDVLFNTDLNLSFGTPQLIGFEVRAQNNIDMAYGGGPHTIFTNGHNVTLSANDLGPNALTPALNTATGTGSIIGGGNIIASYGGGVGGNITLSGYGVNVGTLQTAGGLDLRAGGTRGNVTITALGGGVQTGNISTNGVNGADFSAGQGTPATAAAGGGDVTISAAYGSVITGTIDANGGAGGNGGYALTLAFDGAAGGSGGAVSIGDSTTTSVTTGAITANGGAGGYGGSGAVMAAISDVFSVGSGGSGGSGGVVNLTSSGNVATGAITLSGANGGAGGSNNTGTLDGQPIGLILQSSVAVGDGGSGGNGGSATIAGADISTGAIVAAGGAGADGGNGNTATVTVSASTAGITSASGSASAGSGGSGGFGGRVDLIGTGSVTVAGAIDTSGGASGAGGANGTATANGYGLTNASSVSVFATAGQGGFGGSPGSVGIQSTNGGAITTGAINMAGAAGGAGGTNAIASAYASTQVLLNAILFSSASAGVGGSGGGFGNLFIYGGDVSVGAITTSGGAGGAGGLEALAKAEAYGSASFFLNVQNGDGGQGGIGGSVNITGNTISTGSITTNGGDGGNGGDSTAVAGIGGAGGDGGEGGSIFLTAPVSVAIAGAIDANGGVGGAGGASTAGYGGAGGAGGNNSFVSVFIDPDIVSVGSISAHGGVGGAGGNGGIQGGNGGVGGSGAYVDISSLTYGVLTVGNIDVSGATGGDGGSSGGAGVYGGAGGNGGYGGLAVVQGGSIDLLSGGTILANGGDGGAGGAASAGFGGNGGAAGDGGFAGLFAETATGAYGTIQVASVPTINIDGGIGGASGNIVGASGAVGSFVIFGDLQLPSLPPPPPPPTPTEGSERGPETLIHDINRPIGTTVVPSVEEVEKKDKDKKQNKDQAVCK